MDLKETYNKIAEDWFKDHRSDDWWMEGTDKFISFLKPGAEVLDVGCGAGVKSKYLAEKGYKVTGIDISEKFIEIARREVPQASFVLTDMREVREIGKVFDGVFAQASLLHIPRKEIQEAIGELIAVLEPDGYIYIAVKGVGPTGEEEGILKENDYGYEYERFFSYHRMGELEQYFANLGLHTVYQNTKMVGKTNWLQIIGQKV